MEMKQMEKALFNGNAFLIKKKPILYGGRNIRFDLESKYLEFDGMLKREILYCKFDVLERVAECRIEIAGSSLQIHADHDSLPTRPNHPLQGETFSAFLVRRRYLTLTPTRNFRLVLPSHAGEFELAKDPHGGFTLLAPGMRPRFEVLAESPLPALDVEIEAWLRQAIGEWTNQIPGLRIDISREASPAGINAVLAAWKRISQIDLDLSGEDVPHVFRWQECTRFANAAYVDLSELECRAILKENAADIPKDAQLVGISHLEADDDNGCIALRYAHLLSDPAGHSPEDPPVGQFLRNCGFIVVERDFWEFHIDARDRKLIGEYRKWRE